MAEAAAVAASECSLVIGVCRKLAAAERWRT